MRRQYAELQGGVKEYDSSKINRLYQNNNTMIKQTISFHLNICWTCWILSYLVSCECFRNCVGPSVRLQNSYLSHFFLIIFNKHFRLPIVVLRLFRRCCKTLTSRRIFFLRGVAGVAIDAVCVQTLSVVLISLVTLSCSFIVFDAGPSSIHILLKTCTLFSQGMTCKNMRS